VRKVIDIIFYLFIFFVFFLLNAALTGGERSSEAGAWFTRVGNGDSHPSTPVIFVDFIFLCCIFGHFCIFFCIYPLCILCNGYPWCLGHLDSLYAIYHLHWWPQFLAFVPRINRPESSEALPSNTFIFSVFVLVFILFCPALV
jgi:hypothetical protein